MRNRPEAGGRRLEARALGRRGVDKSVHTWPGERGVDKTVHTQRPEARGQRLEAGNKIVIGALQIYHR